MMAFTARTSAIHQECSLGLLSCIPKAISNQKEYAMRMWQQFDMISLLDTLASLLLAFVLGSLVGLERQYRQRTAGTLECF